MSAISASDITFLLHEALRGPDVVSRVLLSLRVSRSLGAGIEATVPRNARDDFPQRRKDPSMVDYVYVDARTLVRELRMEAYHIDGYGPVHLIGLLQRAATEIENLIV